MFEIERCLTIECYTYKPKPIHLTAGGHKQAHFLEGTKLFLKMLYLLNSSSNYAPLLEHEGEAPKAMSEGIIFISCLWFIKRSYHYGGSAASADRIIDYFESILKEVAGD